MPNDRVCVADICELWGRGLAEDFTSRGILRASDDKVDFGD